MSDGGEPIDPADPADVLTIWASPGLVTDPARPDLGTLAVLTLVPSITVHTSDGHPGAEPIDLITANLLRAGFALVARLVPTELAELPTLTQWTAQLDHSGHRLRVTEPSGTLYDGDVGDEPPRGWHTTLRDRGRLIVLVGTAVDLGTADHGGRIDHAAADGAIVGAQLPLVATSLDSPG